MSLRAQLKAGRDGLPPARWTHAASYLGMSPAGFAHRARLARLRSILRGMELPARGLLVDLGCSDGFILAELVQHGDVPPNWQLAGYDHGKRLLNAARSRGLPTAYFAGIDLNNPDGNVREPGDLVLCLETLEHLGDYRSGLQVIHKALKPNARLVLSMPNEVGMVGLIKLISRPLLRPHPYRGFFKDRQQVLAYAVAVASGRNLEPFRTPPRNGWAPHLGFDYREVMRYIDAELVQTGSWAVDHIERSGFGANRFLIIRRLGAAASDRPEQRARVGQVSPSRLIGGSMTSRATPRTKINSGSKIK